MRRRHRTACRSHPVHQSRAGHVCILQEGRILNDAVLGSDTALSTRARAQVVLPKVTPPPPDQQWGDSGTWLPAALDSHASIAYVMNQEAGRLRIRDLKAAVADKKADAARVQEGLVKVADSSGDIDALDDEAVEAPVKVRAAVSQRIFVVTVVCARVGRPRALPDRLHLPPPQLHLL